MRKKTHSQNNIKENKSIRSIYNSNTCNDDSNTVLNIHIEKFVKTQQHISSHQQQMSKKH